MALLSDEEIEQRLEPLQGWERDGDAIIKSFENDDFKGAVGLGKQPDLVNSRATVTVGLTPPSAGGRTANDFDLASRIYALG